MSGLALAFTRPYRVLLDAGPLVITAIYAGKGPRITYAVVLGILVSTPRFFLRVV